MCMEYEISTDAFTLLTEKSQYMSSYGQKPMSYVHFVTYYEKDKMAKGFIDRILLE